MLSDDITQGISSIFSKTKALIGGAIRGALLGAGIGFVACAIAAAIPAITIGGGILASAGSILGGLFSSTALAGGISGIVGGATIGAGVLGIGSIVPGVSKLLGMTGGLFRRHRDPVSFPKLSPDYAPETTYVNAPQHPPIIVHQAPPPIVVQEQPQQQPIIVQSAPQQPAQGNYLFVEGRGKELMQKGDSAPDNGVCRT